MVATQLPAKNNLRQFGFGT